MLPEDESEGWLKELTEGKLHTHSHGALTKHNIQHLSSMICAFTGLKVQLMLAVLINVTRTASISPNEAKK